MVANAILSTDAAPQLETYPLCTKIKRLFYSVINMAASHYLFVIAAITDQKLQTVNK